MDEKIIHKKESYQIMGAAFEVYKDKGSGFLEAVFQECLAIEFEEQEIEFVEIKAVKTLSDEHRAQVINYLKATGKELGILINFGHYPKVQYERFVNQTT
mgnify:FL=1|tara:strand:+ start:818 stop:1117 length:300 start_codon:yes stop_codon:yes gene_type:complete